MHFSTTRLTWTVILGALAALAVVEGVRLGLLYRSVKGNKRYWELRATEPYPPGEFLYLALGDSVAQGIGASRPSRGYVGLIAQHIERSTGRDVRVINVSSTGATTADVLSQQLPRIQNLHPDLVTLDVGANDLNKKVPEATFVTNFASILDALPAEKTIIAELPTFERGPKQSTLMRLNAVVRAQAVAHQVQLAPIFDVTSTTIHDWTTYAADFFHPSTKGHRNWYHAFATHLDDVLREHP